MAAARQGARTGYCTLVGSDPFGDLLLDLWRREQVDTAAVGRRADAATAVYFVTHSDAGHTFTYYRRDSAASRITPADLPGELAARTRFLQASRSEEHTSELQSLMRISYAVFCLKKKQQHTYRALTDTATRQ